MGFHSHNQVQRHSKRNFIQRSDDSNCLSGGFYTYPTSGTTINSLNTLNITWDTTCLTPANNAVDIYLYVPAASSPRIHIWEDVSYSNGYYEATLMPRWWNSTASEQLQLLIIQSGDAPFMATLPAGPIFTATYSTPSTGTPAAAQTSLGSTDNGVTLVGTSSSASTSSHHLSKGKVAASVIMPLLVVASLLAAWWYIKRSRAKGKAERKQWTEKVDQRMSVVSADWASMSTKGAQAAIRNSMAIRASMDQQRMSSFDQQRMSVMDTTNLAGMGVVAPGGGVGGFFIPGQGDPNVNPIVSMPVPSFIPETSPSTPPLRLNGTGVGLRSSAAPRGSRVISFAAEPSIPGRASGETRRSIYDRERPSVDSRRSAYSQYSTSRGSRAFHYAGDEEEPPMPEGAAERASAFYMLGNNGIGSANDAVTMMRHSHMNVSSSTVNSSANASRMSRFDEIYGVDEEDYSRNRSSGGDYSNFSPSPEFSMTSPDIGGPVALSTSDIQKRIKNGSVSSGSGSAGKPSFEEDVGPALSMMRAQEQEQQDDYFTQAKAQAQAHHLRQSTVSETIFAASPSPYETTFSVPAFPMPTPGVTMPTPSLNGAPIVSTTGSPISYPATSAGGGVFGGMAPPKNAMSPDDMLRAYAVRKESEASASGRASPSSFTSGPSSPIRSSSPSSFSRRASLKNIAKIATPGLNLKSKVSKTKLSIAKISNPSPLAREVVSGGDVQEEEEEEEQGESGVSGEAV